MILGIGHDVVKISRINKIYAKHPIRFLSRVFHPCEQNYAQSQHSTAAALASRFAAKEAALKALGTGLRGYINWYDIYVDHDKYGKPQLNAVGSIQHYLSKKADWIDYKVQWHLSLSHDGDYAQAFVILEGHNK